MPGMMKKPMRRREMEREMERDDNVYAKGGMVDYDAKVAMLDYPGTKGVGMPTGGKQQLTGKGFRGTF